ALFEEITHLPEYYLTRIERALLDDNVPRWVADLRPRSLIELGSGSAVKARIILTAMRAHHDDPMYVPVDISASFLEQSGAELKAEFPRLTILPVATDFTRSLPLPPAVRHPALLTFLGSTIGNFTTPQAE